MADLFTNTPADLTTIQSALDIRTLAAGLDYYPAGSLGRWQKAKGDVRFGRRHAVIAFCGTSHIVGAYAGGSAAVGINEVKSRPNALNIKVAEALNRAGVPASSESFIGNGFNQSSGAAMNRFDDRITPGPFASTGNQLSIGGLPGATSSAGTMSFAFTGAADRIDIYERQTNAVGTGTYSVDIDGTTVVSASQTTLLAAVSVRKVSLSFTAVSSGAHVLNFNWISGNVGLYGADLYLDSRKGVRCLNLGMGGSVAADWVKTNPDFYGPSYVVPNIVQPALTVFECCTNDFLAAKDQTGSTLTATVAAYKANIIATLTAMKTSTGSVLGFTPVPAQATAVSRSVQQLFVTAFLEACRATTTPYLDLWTRFVSWEVMDGNGLMQDSYHLNSAGVWNEADFLVMAILAA